MSPTDPLLALLPIAMVLRRGEDLAPNPSACKLVGRPAEALSTLSGWFDTLFEATAASERATFDAALDGATRVWTVLAADGTRRRLEVEVEPAVGEGPEVWVLRDLTEQTMASERYRMLFERSTEAHLLFDHSGILDCNDAAVKLLGCRDKGHLLNTHPAVFSPERQPDGRLSSEKSVEMDRLARKNGFHRFEWTHRRLDGVDLPIEVTLNPVELVGGPALLVVWRDLTAQRKAERLVQRSLERALEATKTKNRFLANMSHELRTPLNAVLGYSSLLLEEAASSAPQLTEDLGRIESSARHLLALIDDLLDISVIETGQFTIRTEVVEVAALLESVVDAARPAAASRGLHLSTVVGPGSSSLSTDPTRLRQVLSNLLSNACKFTPSGSVVLEARAEGSHQIRFTVKDTGIGIAEDQLPAIFDEFQQVDTSSTRAYGGTGLGLAITRKLCRKMGGDVTVTSQLGVGSVFEVRLPRC